MIFSLYFNALRLWNSDHRPYMVYLNKERRMKRKKMVKDPINTFFGKKIRHRRRELDWTQEKLAERCGMHVTYIGQVERGLRNVSLHVIVDLAKALQCKPEELMRDMEKGIDSPSPKKKK